jgi:hypothetical protein
VKTFQTKAVDSGGSDEGVVVVHCSDPRYQPHFQSFLRQGLGIPRYALLAIPGGVQTLTLVEYLPKFAWSGWRWMKFLANLTSPRRIVLITHDDCRWYLDNRFAGTVNARERQVEDLRRVRRAFRERFGDIEVDLYYAALEDGGARFDAVS